VVALVAVLSGEVRRKKERVEDKAKHVVDELEVWECMVTTLVRDHTHSKEHAALGSPIKWPCHRVLEHAWESWYADHSQVKEARGDEEVVQRGRRRTWSTSAGSRLVGKIRSASLSGILWTIHSATTRPPGVRIRYNTSIFLRDRLVFWA
jgi:hypothetical protein